MFAERLFTAEEFARMPKDPGVRTELVRGRVVRMSPGGVRHFRVIARLTKRLLEYEEQSGLATVLLTTGIMLAERPDTVREPDLALVRRDRFRELGEVAGFYPGVPDLVIEVLSPTDRPGATQEKVAQYLEHGVRVIWVIDPSAPSVSVHRPDMTVELRTREAALDARDLFPGLRIELASILDDHQSR